MLLLVPFLQCLAISLIFVGSVQACRKVVTKVTGNEDLTRDDPSQILGRAAGTLLASAASWVPLWFTLSEHERLEQLLSLLGLTKPRKGLLFSVFLGAGLSSLLLLGAYIDKMENLAKKLASKNKRSGLSLEFVRDVLIAPLTEEFCFRSCMCALLKANGLSSRAVIAVPSCLFGLSHTLRLVDVLARSNSSARWEDASTRRRRLTDALSLVGGTVCMTTAFGVVASILFVFTGHFACPLSAHMTCNFIGPPDLEKLTGFRDTKGNFRYAFLTYAGLVSFSGPDGLWACRRRLL